ncbi:hypothetical protein BJ170DRAFT_686137 [Xylariales sp. AK1849]|nr:hypothetical protein BJ170DRAFT_686137 [Xylariales sp. AK1849]
MPEVIVVGGGVMGSSVAEACLIAGIAGENVKWIDDNASQRTAASDDIARITRPGYADPAYGKLAKSAFDMCMTEEPYSESFHHSGWWLIQSGKQAQNGSISAGDMAEDANDTFAACFPDAIDTSGLRITTSDSAGWLETDRLQDALKVRLNIKPQQGTVASLIFDGKTCRGVELQTGEKFLADKIILATGWRTNKLLEPHDLGPIPYIIAGIPTIYVKLTEPLYEKYKNMKIICEPGKGEILPPTPQRFMKVNSPKSYELDYAEATDAMSLPSTHPCFETPRKHLQNYIQDLKGCEETARFYCDALGKNQEFHVGKVEGTENLFSLCNGSFHLWKFRPVLPKYIAAVLGFTDDEQSRDQWKSLRTDKPKHADLIPKQRWRDVQW